MINQLLVHYIIFLPANMQDKSLQHVTMILLRTRDLSILIHATYAV